MNHPRLVRRILGGILPALFLYFAFMKLPPSPISDDDWGSARFFDAERDAKKWGWWRVATGMIPQYPIPGKEIALAAVALVGLVGGGMRWARRVAGRKVIGFSTAVRVTALAVALVIAGTAFHGAAHLYGRLHSEELTHGRLRLDDVVSLLDNWARPTPESVRQRVQVSLAISIHEGEFHIACIDGPTKSVALFLPVDPQENWFEVIEPKSGRLGRRFRRDRLSHVIRDIEAGREPSRADEVRR